MSLCNLNQVGTRMLGVFQRTKSVLMYTRSQNNPRSYVSSIGCCSHYLKINNFSIRLLSTDSQKLSTDPITPTNTTAGSSEPIKIGHFYQQILYKGRKTNELSMGNLKKLILLCENQEHLKYILYSVDLYQLKGYDFSEELCSLFLKACVKCGPEGTRKGMEKLAKYKYRIGAWITATSFHNIIRNYIDHHLSNQISDKPIPPSTNNTSVPDESSGDATIQSVAAGTSPATISTEPIKTERITLKSKVEDIKKLPNDILLIQVLDILIQKGLKPVAETLDLIKMNIGPQEESNLVYQKFQYLEYKVNHMNK